MADTKPPRRMHTRDLVAKIEKLTRERMAKEKVVNISDLRHKKEREEPATILVIEDDETIRAALKRIFEGEGYRVVAAADGTHLSEVLDDQPIDLIILDIGLPWINGYELAEMMKGHGDLKNIPLIFVSGRTSEEDVKQGFAVGADDFIKKPFDIEKIKKTVNTLMHLAHG
jgi:two-component system, OmpR family, aerobic respiration control protein ArcA